MKAGSSTKVLMALAIVISMSALGFYITQYFVTQKKQPIATITVFAHGTIGSAFNLLNPLHCMADTADDSTRCIQITKSYRNHPSIRYDQMLSDEGFVLFDQLQLQSCKSAACHLIQAYDEAKKLVQPDHQTNYYALFGWSGDLSQRARKNAGFELYKKLCDYRDQIGKQHGTDPCIEIVTHSHGGNVALWLAHAELAHQRKLHIDTLVMLGTPIQRETAPCIKSTLFNNIILGYSEGDSVQTSDYFSSFEHKSYQRMSDIVDLKKFITYHPNQSRADMRFVVNNDTKRITHTNMWFTSRSTPILDFMDPMPLVIVIPFFIHALKKQPDYTHYNACLDGTFGSCSTYLATCTEPQQKDEPCNSEFAEKVFQFLFSWRNKLLHEWQTDDLSRNVLLNKTNWHAYRDALWSNS